MSIIPKAALTTVQIVSGLAASAKNAVDLAKSTSNSELKGAVSELFDSVLDVKARVLELDEENRRLTKELEQKDEIVGPEGKDGFFFYKSKPGKPLCPKCWQSPTKKNAVFLTETDYYGPGYKCIICNSMWDR